MSGVGRKQSLIVLLLVLLFTRYFFPLIFVNLGRCVYVNFSSGFRQVSDLYFHLAKIVAQLINGRFLTEGSHSCLIG